jgi:DNA-binding transcriptional MocR family regulator
MPTKLPDKTYRPGSWVQTERKAHERWAQLCVMNPRAGALLHVLASKVGEHNAVVASHSTLASLMGSSPSTVKRALEALTAGNWIEVRQLGKTGSVNAYVVNDRVVWSGPRDGLRHSLFSANVLVSEEEQPDRDSLGNQEPLIRLPRIGERQMPVGDGMPPPSEPALPLMEPELPATPERRSEPMRIGSLLAGLIGKAEER